MGKKAEEVGVFMIVGGGGGVVWLGSGDLNPA